MGLVGLEGQNSAALLYHVSAYTNQRQNKQSVVLKEGVKLVANPVSQSVSFNFVTRDETRTAFSGHQR